MTTFSDLVERAKTELEGTGRAEFNFLNEALDAVEIDVTFADSAGGITRGAVIAIDDELMYVRSVTGQDATVVRGWKGTTAATHTLGAFIEVNPRFPGPFVLRAILADIRTWPETIFVTEEVAVTIAEAEREGEITPTRTPHNLRWVNFTADDGQQVRLAATLRETNGNYYAVLDRVATDDVSGLALLCLPHDLSTVDLTTDIADVGLAEDLAEAAVYGACYRLLGGREARRTFTEAQGRSRAAEEVPPLSSVRAATWFKQVRDEILASHALRLAARYPAVGA